MRRFWNEADEGGYSRRGEYPPLNPRQPQLVWGGVDGWRQPRGDHDHDEDEREREETLPFFAAMCAAYAISLLLHSRHTSKSLYSDSGSGTGNYGYKLRREEVDLDIDMEDGEGRERERQRAVGMAGFLFDLSVQTLGVWSGTCTGTATPTTSSTNAAGGGGRKDNDPPSDLDCLVARLLQVVYLLLDGTLGDSHSGGESGRVKVFELVRLFLTSLVSLRCHRRSLVFDLIFCITSGIWSLKVRLTTLFLSPPSFSLRRSARW